MNAKTCTVQIAVERASRQNCLETVTYTVMPLFSIRSDVSLGLAPSLLQSSPFFYVINRLRSPSSCEQSVDSDRQDGLAVDRLTQSKGHTACPFTRTFPETNANPQSIHAPEKHGGCAKSKQSNKKKKKNMRLGCRCLHTVDPRKRWCLLVVTYSTTGQTQV